MIKQQKGQPNSKPTKEKQEGRGHEGVTPGMYNVHEDGTSEMDEEIRCLSFVGIRTRKLAPMVVGGLPL